MGVKRWSSPLVPEMGGEFSLDLPKRQDAPDGDLHRIQAYGDETRYRDHRDRYRALATSLGFEGHIKWAEALP